MKDAIRVGVIGVGYMGRLHTLKYAMHPKAQLIGVFDTNHKQAAKVGQELGVHAYTSLDDLLEVIDACTIATPTATHFLLAKQCLAQGKHVLLEKPLTETVEEGKILAAIAQKRALCLLLGTLPDTIPRLFGFWSMIGALQVTLRRSAWALLSHVRSMSMSFMTLWCMTLIWLFCSCKSNRSTLARLALLSLPSKSILPGHGSNLPKDAWPILLLLASRQSQREKFRLFWHAHYASIDFFKNTLSVSHKVEETIKMEDFHFEAPDLLYAEIDSFWKRLQVARFFALLSKLVKFLS